MSKYEASALKRIKQVEESVLANYSPGFKKIIKKGRIPILWESDEKGFYPLPPLDLENESGEMNEQPERLTSNEMLIVKRLASINNEPILFFNHETNQKYGNQVRTETL